MYDTGTSEISAVDETHPGFEALFFWLHEGDLIHVVSTVTSPILFVVVANTTYWDWRNQYYAQSTPLDLADNYQNCGNGTLRSYSHYRRTEHDDNSLAAPADGEYVWVFLNKHGNFVEVTYSADVTHTDLLPYAAFTFYAGIASCLIGTAVLAFFMHTDIGL